MKYVVVLLLAAMAGFCEMSVCGTEELLPIGFTDEERSRLNEIGINTVPTSPPDEGAMNPGEYDPATGVFMRWPMGLPDALVVAFSEDTQLWVICTSSQQGSAENHFNNVGVNMSNVSFINASTNTIWVRDYGPWFLMLDDGQQGIFNYTYNRPRPLDNEIPNVIGAEWGIPVYTSTIEHTGGNYMSSGFGQSMSTDMVISENGGDQDWVDSQMALYLGVDNYITVPDPQGSYIDHIDCWGKMLSPGRLLVLQVPPGHGDYAALEAMADMLGNTPSPFGTNWEVFRVFSSGSEGYTNSLINNDHVYVPTFNTSNDAPALAAYENALPGYTVEGFYYSGWDPTDALHCRSRNVMDNEMLLIQHVPVDEYQVAGNPVTIDALIKNHPDNTLLEHDLNYRVGSSGTFTTISMTVAGTDSFTANIPGFASGQLIQYYIEASDNSGREESRPRYAPDTWFFEYTTSSTGIEDDGTAPGLILSGTTPNPFSGNLQVDYSSSSQLTAVFRVIDISGRTVERNELDVYAGTGTMVWTAPDHIPDGIYFISIQTGTESSTKMVTLIR